MLRRKNSILSQEKAHPLDFSVHFKQHVSRSDFAAALVALEMATSNLRVAMSATDASVNGAPQDDNSKTATQKR